MVAQSADAAVARALRQERNTPGMCLANVRTWLGIDSEQFDAISCWVNAWGKHPGEKDAPRGAPRFYAGGSSGHGHITLDIGHGAERTTDRPVGYCDTVPNSYIPQVWGMTYLGWAEGINSTWIPYLHDDSPYASGDVYVRRLVVGTLDSDSVARLRYRLDRHPDMQGSGHRPGDGRGYGAETVEAVRYWQRDLPRSFPGPRTGKDVSNAQAQRLFGDNYRVHPE